MCEKLPTSRSVGEYLGEVGASYSARRVSIVGMTPYPEMRRAHCDLGSSIPSHWVECQLRHLAGFQSGEAIAAESIKEEGAYPVFGGNGIRGYTKFYTHSGSFPLIGRQGALCGNVNFANGDFWASEHAVVAQPRNGIEPKWLASVLLALELRKYSVAAAQPGLAVEAIKRLCVARPPVAEQRAIARFLDYETARIDALIAKQERLIELLQEKRQAVISHAVTKGLNPDAPMKDSGVEWLGEVPAHWEVLQFRRGFTFLTDYEANGSFAATKEMVNLDEGEPYAWFVRATDLENGRIGLIQGNRYCDETSYQFLSKTKLDGGELLIAKRGEIGKVYQLPELSCRATLAPNLYSIKLSKKIITQFAFYWFSSSFGRPQLELANKSTTIGALYKDDVRALICIFPPVSEQHEITKRVDEQIRHVDLMIAEAEKIISLSSERRSALISAAVTGKIDVRGWQPPASTQAPELAVAEAN